MSYYTANLAADVDRYLDDEDAYHNSLPECDWCGGKIDDDYYVINNVVMCKQCVETCLRHG